MANISHLAGKALISCVVSFVHAMAAPMPQTKLCENIVVVNPADDDKEIIVLPSQTVATRFSYDIFAATGVPDPMPRCSIEFVDLEQVSAQEKKFGQLVTSNEQSSIPAALFCTYSGVPNTPFRDCWSRIKAETL